MTILTTIPKDLLAKYNAYEMTSNELAGLTGYHPAALRRAIKRPKRPPKDDSSQRLLAARKAFRLSLGYLPPREIQVKANVSAATAGRIRRAYKDMKARNA